MLDLAYLLPLYGSVHGFDKHLFPILVVQHVQVFYADLDVVVSDIVERAAHPVDVVAYIEFHRASLFVFPIPGVFFLVAVAQRVFILIAEISIQRV